MFSLWNTFGGGALLFAVLGRLVAADSGAVKFPALPQVSVSTPRGYCEGPVLVKLASPVAGAAIHFTLDGTEPTAAHGRIYAVPLQFTNTTRLRVAAFKDGAPVSAVGTHSYLFLDQILHQPREPAGYSAGAHAWGGQPAAFAMDARVVDDPTYHDQMKDSLRSLPLVSVVCRHEDLFGPRGLYLNSTERGEGWERACSVEMILPDGGTAFQIDCGLRIQGNYNRIPNRSPKHSFRLVFKEPYGPSKLHYQVFPDSPVKKFDTLVLRADYNNSWIHKDAPARRRAQRTRDAWMKDSARAMGWVAGHNRYVHLFLNGLYWGVYDFAERPDASFAAAYFGGSKEDYDVINEFQAKDGSLDAFRALTALHGFSRSAQLRKLEPALDLTNYIDYLLVNYYAGNEDWGENKNWYALRRRVPAGPFQYFVWDGEQVLQGLQDDCVSNSFEPPFRLAEELKHNPEFCLRFADRVQKHFFGEGALTPAAVTARWLKRAAEVERAMVAESARWGSYRQSPPYTRDREWLTEQRRLVRNYFPQRSEIVLGQLRAAGLYPEVPAPVFDQARGATGNNFRLALTSPGSGTIYYTTNGLDPRVPYTSAVTPGALLYTGPLSLGPSAQVKARVLNDHLWSALSEAAFTNAPAGN